ncbi:MAG: aldo/keto reductase, partial [Christiangramia sp.]|nr:aldo/keto reductase [Christiangramia sp.]
MNYRKFGNTDLEISEIGFGAWAIGGGEMIGDTAIGWGDVDDEVSKKAIHRSLDLGINFFDTADIYGLNHSEKILGKVLDNQNDVIIATKVGNVARNGQFTTDYSRDYIIKACEASLRRLKRESIDYYQLHTARLSDLEKGECIEAMQSLKKQGKIRYWGLSLNTFEPQPEANYLIQNELGSGFQLVLNILNQTAVPLLKNASDAGYGIIARMPLQFGLLTGKFDSGAEFPSNDHRKGRLTKEVIYIYREAMEPVWKLCDKYDIGKTQLALSFILGFKEVSVVIPGIRTA